MKRIIHFLAILSFSVLYVLNAYAQQTLPPEKGVREKHPLSALGADEAAPPKEFPGGFYNDFLSDQFRPGGLQGQGLWTTGKTGRYDIAPDGLSISNSDGAGAVLHRTMNEGVILLKIKGGSKFVVGYHYQPKTGARYACWSPDGKTIFSGIASGIKKLDTVSITSATLPMALQDPDQYYDLRIAIGPVNGKSFQSFWVWNAEEKTPPYVNPDGSSNAWMTAPFSYENDSLHEGWVQLGSLSGVSGFRSLRINDYNDKPNYLTRKATFIGNWFNTMQGVTPYPASLMTFTSGSEIRFDVEHATQATLSLFINAHEIKPYQPYVDVQYRDMTNPGGWSGWTRHQVPWGSFPDNVHVRVVQGLHASHRYQIRCVFDIYDSDSSWVYGMGAIVKDIHVDPGGHMYPSDISRQPVIMAFGNSITAGVRQFLTTSGAIDQPYNLLSYNSYFHIACDSLDAIPYNQAYGGTGINRSWAPAGMPRAMTSTQYFKRGRPRHSVTPSLILLNEGSNDNIHDTTTLVRGYIHLIRYLQRIYASSEIVIIIPFSQKFAGPIRKMAASLGLKAIETADWHLTYTDGGHPDSLSQRKAGDSLYLWIKTNIEWKTTHGSSSRRTADSFMSDRACPPPAAATGPLPGASVRGRLDQAPAAALGDSSLKGTVGVQSMTSFGPLLGKNRNDAVSGTAELTARDPGR